jgi:hypothetical protein
MPVYNIALSIWLILTIYGIVKYIHYNVIYPPVLSLDHLSNT